MALLILIKRADKSSLDIQYTNSRKNKLDVSTDSIKATIKYYVCGQKIQLDKHLYSY